MLNDWIQWLSSRTLSEVLLLTWPLLCVDGLRYCLATVVMCLWDGLLDAGKLLGLSGRAQPAYAPSVCVVLAGLNEADTVGAGKIFRTEVRDRCDMRTGKVMD